MDPDMGPDNIPGVRNRARRSVWAIVAGQFGQSVGMFGLLSWLPVCAQLNEAFHSVMIGGKASLSCPLLLLAGLCPAVSRVSRSLCSDSAILLLLLQQTYFVETYGVDLAATGSLTALPYFGQIIVGLVVAVMADKVITAGRHSRLNVRRVAHTVGTVGPAVCMLLLGASGRSLGPTAASHLLTLGMSLPLLAILAPRNCCWGPRKIHYGNSLSKNMSWARVTCLGVRIARAGRSRPRRLEGKIHRAGPKFGPTSGL